MDTNIMTQLLQSIKYNSIKKRFIKLIIVLLVCGYSLGILTVYLIHLLIH